MCRLPQEQKLVLQLLQVQKQALQLAVALQRVPSPQQALLKMLAAD